jgi:hypothetical protein
LKNATALDRSATAANGATGLAATSTTSDDSSGAHAVATNDMSTDVRG